MIRNVFFLVKISGLRFTQFLCTKLATQNVHTQKKITFWNSWQLGFLKLCLFFDQKSLLQFIRSKLSTWQLQVGKMIIERGNTSSKVKLDRNNFLVNLPLYFSYQALISSWHDLLEELQSYVDIFHSEGLKWWKEEQTLWMKIPITFTLWNYE